jgi:hypothetical protein
VVDVIGKFCVEVTQHVIGQRRKMHDCVEPAEILFVQIADVFANFRNLRSGYPEVAAGKKVRVKPDHFMSGGTQNRSGDGANVAFMAG